MKKALIVTALAGFVRSFLTSDIELLQKMGYEVYCAANKYHPGAENIDEYFTNNNVNFFQVDFSSNKPISLDTLKSYIQLKKIVKENKFDFVHCHTPIAGAIARWSCKKYRKIGMKVAYTTHGFYFHKKSSKKSWLIFNTIESIMSRYSDAIITINKEDFENARDMHCKNVYQINGVGVDLGKFKNVTIDREQYREEIGISKDEIMILSVGELSKRKNQKVILQALGILKNPQIVFVHCGNAMNKDATTEEVKSIAKENNIKTIFLGLRKDIPQICHCADIGTLSSTREGLGLAGIEMLASGLPVVASNVHGILDYMQDGINGYLADPYKPEEFAEGIRKLVDSNTMRKNEIMNSVEKFDKKNSIKQMGKIYKEILN
ncbi:MAG: glycosyltransferase [Clostridia bacterium]|nr:glycosyltransferase [Clostridia bacterium]